VSGQPCGLSVTRSHNLLVALRNSKIIEYTTHGSVIRSIELDYSIRPPFRAIELTTGQFVIGQGISLADNPLTCIVDTSGHIIHSYSGPGRNKNSYSGLRNRSLRFNDLAVDRHDNIFMTDHKTREIQLFSPTLSHCGHIALSKDLPLGAHCIHLDNVKDLLFVTDGMGCLLIVGSNMGLEAISLTF